MALPIPTNRPGFSWIWFLLLTGLSILSWASTYTGIMELIAASSGEVGLDTRVAVAFAVCMLQLMTLYILDSLFSETLRWWLRPLYLAGYGVLFLIAVGFAFGFYWKYLEAGSVTASAAEASLMRIQEAMQTGTSRLEQLQSTFGALETISTGKAEQERTSGGTCAGGGGGGDGPRRRLRETDAQRFRFANAFIAERVTTVKTDIAAIGTELKRIADKAPSTIDASGSRAAFMGEMNRKLSLTATRFNALRSDPQLAQLSDEFKTRAGQNAFPDDRGGTFLCPDPQLQTALSGVVRAIGELPELHPAPLRNYEGSEAVLEAFRRLTASGIAAGHGLAAALQNAVALTGAVPQATTGAASTDGLSERDYIPLVIAIFVDLCILLVSINRPFSRVLRTLSSMESARDSNLIAFLTPVYRVFSGNFDPHSPPKPDDIIAPLVDAVFDHEGRYYAAAPVSSRYVSSAFDLLQGQNFVRLLRNRKGLDDAAIRKKLEKRSSVLAGACSFRVFEFAPDAWAEFLNAALGSAAAAEMRAVQRREKAAPRDAVSQRSRARATGAAYFGGRAVALAVPVGAGNTEIAWAPDRLATVMPVLLSRRTNATLSLIKVPGDVSGAENPSGACNDGRAATAEGERAPANAPVSASVSAPVGVSAHAARCVTPLTRASVAVAAPRVPETPASSLPPRARDLLALPSPRQQLCMAALEEGVDPDPSEDVCCGLKFLAQRGNPA